MKKLCIYLIAITTLSTYIYSNTMSAREKKEIAACSANFRFKYIIFENNKLLNCISDDSTEKIDKINVMNKLLNECPFSLSVDSIEVPSAVKDSISVFRFEFKSYNKELSDQLCFKYPADTIVIGVDNNGYSFFLHGFESNEFQAIL